MYRQKRVVGQGRILAGTPTVHEVTADEYVPMRIQTVSCHEGKI